MFVITTLLAISSWSQSLNEDASYAVSYRGRLTPVTVSDEKAIVKAFDVLWFLPRVNGNEIETLTLVTEETYALPWPARFQFSSFQGDNAAPQIGYRFGDRDYRVDLPNPILRFAEQLQSQKEVVDGTMRYTVTGEDDVDGRRCLLVDVKTNFGRDRTLAIDKESGLAVRHEETVFLGRGDRFLLTLEIDEIDQLSEDRTVAHQAFASLLRKVESITQQNEQAATQDLSKKSLTEILEMQQALTDSASGTPYEAFASAIVTDVKEQQRRAEGVEGIAKKLIGSPAPPIALSDIDGNEIEKSLTAEKVVVLHFWDYDNGSLEAPYGQVGFLDFLHRKRGESGVAVVGVAVNPAFQEASTRGKPAQSAKTLASFMNLSFPIASDDGTLLSSFGDPRKVGAVLPLWVVIDREGIVRGYKSGLYEAKANEGLKELDDLVNKLLD